MLTLAEWKLMLDLTPTASRAIKLRGRSRNSIINYQAEQICSIGSGAIESTVKQIDRRTKISGAQWKVDNVPQVLAHRCAYLNGLISAR